MRTPTNKSGKKRTNRNILQNYGLNHEIVENQITDNSANFVKPMSRKVHLIDKGLIDYKECWDFQEAIFKETVDQKIALRDQKSATPTTDHLIFCQHPHVYTLGKSGKAENLL